MKPVLFLFVCAILVASAFSLSEDVKSRMKYGIKEYLRTGVKNKAYRDIVESIKLPHMFRSNYEPLFHKDIYCSLCDSVIDGVIHDRRNGTSFKDLKEYVISMCINLNIEEEVVCRGMVELNAEIILHIVDNKLDLTSTHLCAVVLQSYDCETDTPVEWEVTIPEPTTTAPEKELSGNSLKILQLTDIHYDPRYKTGSLTACGRPVCCQTGLPDPTNPEDGAGYWGDYRDCDSPWHVIEETLAHISETHNDIDIIYFTGDIISHLVWATTQQDNTDEIIKVLQAFQDYFESVPVFPILGNHEPHPLNVWVDSLEPHITSQWAFDLVAKEWRRWLPAETEVTIKQGGFYTVLFKKGLRIIGLNSNVCYTFNWWLFYDEQDPFGQLQWLVEVLEASEKNNERVHILSHIPSGTSECLKNWSKQFRRIVERYSGTIAAIFNGHTHNDQFVVYFKQDNLAEAAAVAYNGGSATTYSDMNSNYRMYDADAETFEIIDHETWIYNVTEANLTPDVRPKWFKEYSFKEAFGMERLRPNDMAELIYRMAEDQTLLDKYFEYFVKQGDTSLAVGCDSGCKWNHLCDIVANEYGDNAKCEELTALFNP